MAFRSWIFITLRVVQILSLLIVLGVYADIVHGLHTARPELFHIFSGLETTLNNDLQGASGTKKILEEAIYYVVKFIDYIFKVPGKIYVAVGCSTWVLVSTTVSDIVCRVRKDQPRPWRLPLEIFNACFLLPAFIAAAIFAADLEIYCIPLDGVWWQVKVSIQDLASKLSIIISVCPLSKAGAAFIGLAAFCFFLTSIGMCIQRRNAPRGKKGPSMNSPPMGQEVQMVEEGYSAPPIPQYSANLRPKTSELQ